MPAWKGIVGSSFNPDEFDAYCHTLQWTAWRPSFIVLHNTGAPSLAQRPNGLTKKHIQGLEAYYRDDQKWSAGPHLFVDDKQVWVFTPLTVSGVHSPSWNQVALGVEMLGDYEKEAFDSGRGLKVRQNAVAALATLCAVLGFDVEPKSIRLHREDPLTTHACPGKNVRKLEVIQSVQDLLLSRHSGEHALKPAP
ncbi:MAG TPA: peptidoglycan recognition family protein [Thermoanaerobaculia bacterium]|nr:peptidoglycan recognition family protein [Thermoanaerobaculia bacterium]